MNDFTKNYEANIGNTYSELGKEGYNPDAWGNVIYQGKQVNSYTDPGIIRDFFTSIVERGVENKDEHLIGADLGGAEGTVTDIMQKQLREDGFGDANVINFELLDKSLKKMQERYPTMLGVKADLLELPLRDESVDFAVLRYVLPYLNQEGQRKILANAFAAIKPNGRLIVMQDGGYDKETGELYNRFFAESSAAQSGMSLEQVEANRFFLSGEELASMAHEVGFEVEEAQDISDLLQGFLSPEAYASRFNMNDEQLHNLQAVYTHWKEMDQLEFSNDRENPENIRIKRPTIYLVLKKIKDIK